MLQNYTDGFSRSHKKLIEMELFFVFYSFCATLPQSTGCVDLRGFLGRLGKLGKGLMGPAYKELRGGFFLSSPAALHLPKRRMLLLSPPSKATWREEASLVHSGMGCWGHRENPLSSREEPILNCSLLILAWAVPFCLC